MEIVGPVLLLAVLIYGTLQWSRRRRGPTQAVREASTRELYREGAKAKSGKKRPRRRRGKSSPANRRASVGPHGKRHLSCNGAAARAVVALCRHPGGSFGDRRAYARRYSILTASGIFRRSRRAPGLGLAGRVLRSQLIQSPFANAHPRAPQDNLHPTKCKRPSSGRTLRDRHP